MKIRTFIILTFLGIALLIAVHGHISYSDSERYLEKSISENLETLTIQTIDNIESRVDNKIEYFQSYVVEQSIIEFISESNQKFEKLASIENYIIEKDGEWISAFSDEITPFMQNIFENDVSKILITKQDFFKTKYEYPVFGELFITNAYGANIAQTGKTSDYKQNDELWWIDAKENGLYIGNVDFDDSSDIFSKDIAIRIDDEDGKFLGVMKIVYNIQDMIRVIEDFKQPEFSAQTMMKITLLEKDGKVIYSNMDYNIFEKISEEWLSEMAFQSGTFVLQKDDSQKLLAYASTQKHLSHDHIHDIGFIFIIEDDVNQILEPVIQLRNFSMTVAAIIAGISIVIGMYVSYSISNPISKLIDVTKEIAKGNLKTRVATSGSDEISQLGKDIDYMAQELSKQQENLVKSERLSTIGQLASRLAHDLRNPLSVIEISLENLRLAYGQTKETKSSFVRMEKAMNRITHQIETVLDFVRIASPKLEDHSTIKILESAISMLKIPDTIKLNMPSEDRTISCDEKQCEIVFYNLIQNSIQAMGNQSGEITIRIIEQEKDTLVEFEDTGPGIPENILKDIFEPLFTTKQTGTGLGLASCKNIVENFGGEITVRTNPTIFTIYFQNIIKK